jgi:hypothetical protein
MALFNHISPKTAVYKKHAKWKNLLKLKNSVSEDSGVHYFGIIEDIPELMPDPLGKFLEIVPEVPYVLYPIVPAEERIRSLVTRDHADMTLDDIDSIVDGYFHVHNKRVHIANRNIKSTEDTELVSRCFSNIILMDGFERLVELHNSGKVNLIVLTKDTILNNPQAIFDYLGIDRQVKEVSARRMDKTDKPQRLELLDKILKETKPKVDARYDEIGTLIKTNSITVL